MPCIARGKHAFPARLLLAPGIKFSLHLYSSLDANSPEDSLRGASQAPLDLPKLEVPPITQQNNPHSPNHYRNSPFRSVKFQNSSNNMRIGSDELPKTVTSVRDGWQWTSQSGAVVARFLSLTSHGRLILTLAQSGLLAAVAAQLLGFFKDKLEDVSPAGAADFVIASCYTALFLNVAATIGSFVLIDNLGEVGYRAAKLDAADALIQIEAIGDYRPPISKLLKEFGATQLWNGMLYHCEAFSGPFFAFTGLILITM
ncbi:unnamed protein product [Cyclocybe aegerita]|uniref:Uncharacterized protein n=1 Tax=Cyclocybe aegerita TaxID=1973307 RepID=A0A8S0XR93_CYCAE|nr:unnamed protein product [Cyclocybe aegerita]